MENNLSSQLCSSRDTCTKDHFFFFFLILLLLFILDHYKPKDALMYLPHLMHCLKAKMCQSLSSCGVASEMGSMFDDQEEFYNRHWIDAELLGVNDGLGRKP